MGEAAKSIDPLGHSICLICQSKMHISTHCLS